MAVGLAALLPSWELHLRAERKSPETVKSYGDGVRRFLAWADGEGRPAVLDRASVTTFTADLLEAGAEPATARARQLALRRFSAWLLEEGESDADQLLGLRAPKLDAKVVEPLTAEQIRALVAACAGRDLRDRRDEALVRLLIETGARAGEVVALGTPDVDLATGTAVVRRGKGGRGRVVPFGPQTARALDRYLRARRGHRLAGTPALWLGDRGKAFSYDALHKALGERARAAGIEGFRPHRLRHTAAHRWLDRARTSTPPTTASRPSPQLQRLRRSARSWPRVRAPRPVASASEGEHSVPRGDAAGASPSRGRSGGMYARSTTMRVRPETLDDLIAYIRDEVMPMVTRLDGCVGLSLLTDRDTGRCIATSAWETDHAMHASAEQVSASRERAAEVFGVTPEVQEWEIAVLHRAHRAGDGACARVAWTRTDPANLDRVIDAYRESLMPWWEETPGFCSNSLMVNRRDGRCASAVVFESREAMSHTRDQFTTLREEFVARMGMDILEVAEFDLALAHLRVPETV